MTDGCLVWPLNTSELAESPQSRERLQKGEEGIGMYTNTEHALFQDEHALPARTGELTLLSLALLFYLPL